MSDKEGALLRRDPETFYLDYDFWIPKSVVSEHDIRRMKTLNSYMVPALEGGGFDVIAAYTETDTHLIVPRHSNEARRLWEESQQKLVKVVPNFPSRDLRSSITLDYRGTTHQRESVAAWYRAGNGILNLACGKGKTVVALEIIAREHTTAAVVVHTADLLRQWVQAARKFLPGVKVGVVKRDRWDWEGKDVVVMSIQTLVSRVKEISPQMRAYFGLVIWDEVHHLAADKFGLTADLFLGKRLGLSATIKRNDGLDELYLKHLGRVFYSDLGQELKPAICFYTNSFTYDFRHPEVVPQITDVRGQLNLARMRTWVCTQDRRLRWEADLYRWLISEGRKTLVLSHSVDHLKKLHEILGEQSGLCIGEVTDADLRHFHLHNFNLVLGTTQLAREGLDRQEFDTLVISTPFGSGIAGQNSFQQAVGRILRPVSGKTPVVIILDDLKVPKLHGMVLGMRWMIQRWPVERGGPYSGEYVSDVEQIKNRWESVSGEKNICAAP